MSIRKLNEKLNWVLEQNRNLKPGHSLILTLYRLGDPQVYELNGVEFYLGDDEELENGIEVCVDEEFLPNWIEQNEDITGYCVDNVEFSERTGEGSVKITLE